MMRELTLLWSGIKDPEYLHLLLEPVPLFGLLFGMIFLLAGILMELPKIRILALIVVVVSTSSVYWYMKMRAATEPRVAATTSPTFFPFVKKQTALRQSTVWVYYTTAGVGLAALLFGAGSRGSIFSYFALAVFAAALVHSVWLHRKESEIYHPNIQHYVSPK